MAENWNSNGGGKPAAMAVKESEEKLESKLENQYPNPRGKP